MTPTWTLIAGFVVFGGGLLTGISTTTLRLREQCANAFTNGMSAALRLRPRPATVHHFNERSQP